MCDGCISDVDLPLRILLVALVLLCLGVMLQRAEPRWHPPGWVPALCSPRCCWWCLAPRSDPKAHPKPCRVPAGGESQPLLLQALLHEAGQPLVVHARAGHVPEAMSCAVQPLRVPVLQAGTKTTKPSSDGTGEHCAVPQACARAAVSCW